MKKLGFRNFHVVLENLKAGEQLGTLRVNAIS
jgi:hypothetical protein